MILCRVIKEIGNVNDAGVSNYYRVMSWGSKGSRVRMKRVIIFYKRDLKGYFNWIRLVQH